MNFSRRFRLPAGISWARDIGFFVQTPPGPRPFFDWLRANPTAPYSTIMVSNHHVYVKVGPAGNPLSPGYDESAADLVTWQELEQLGPRVAAPPTPEETSPDPDFIFIGRGVPFSLFAHPKFEPFLSDTERGLILQSGIRFSGNDIEIRTGFEPEELRSLLLLWDKIDWPDHSKLRSQVEGDAAYLIETGVMRRTVRDDLGTVVRKSELLGMDMQAFEGAEKIEPGRWAIASGSNSTQAEAHGRGLLVQLNDLIIVPSGDVPLEDILNFKVKRRDELLALRTYLDDVYLAIDSANDTAAAFALKVEALKRAVDDQVRVATEGGIKHTLNKARAAFSVENLVEAAMAGGLALVPTATTQAFALAAGGLVAIKAVTNIVKPTTGSGPLRYIFSAHRELAR